MGLLRTLCRRLWTSFNLGLLAAHRYMLRKPRLALSVSVAMCVALIPALVDLKAVFSFSDIADPGLREASQLRRYQKEFKAGTGAWVFWHTQEPGTALMRDQLESIRLTINQTCYQSAGACQVVSPLSLRRVELRRDALWYPALLSLGNSSELKDLAETPWGGLFTDRLGKDFGAYFEWQSFTPDQPKHLVDSLLNGLDGPKASPQEVRVSFAGEGVLQYFLKIGMTRNVPLSALMLLLILMICRLLFGTWRSGGLFCLSVGFAAWVTFGLMSLFGVSVDVVSSGLFLMLAVAGLEDFLFVCYYRLNHLNQSWRTGFRKMVLPGFFTSLTTMFGFMSLTLSDLGILRKFGLWAAVGSLMEWVAIFLLLPTLLMLSPRMRGWVREEKVLLHPKNMAFLKTGLKKGVLILLLLGIPLGVYSAFNLHLSGAPKRFFPKDHPYVEGLNYLRSSRGWESTVNVVFGSGIPVQAVENVVKEIGQLPNVQEMLDEERIVRWLTRGLDLQTASLVRREFRAAGVSASFKSEQDSTAVAVYLKDSDLEPMSRTLREIRTLCQDGVLCYTAGESAVFAEFSNQVPRALIQSLGSSLLLVGLVIILILRALRYPWSLVTPLLLATAWGPLVTLGILWCFDIRINFMTGLFASVLVGLAGDNAIQFLFAGRRRALGQGIQALAGGSWVISVTLALASLMFLGSYFVSAQVLGVVLAGGLLLSAFGDIWILQSLLKIEKAPRG